MKLATIAQMMQVPFSQVKYVCSRDLLAKKRKPKKVKEERILEEQHIAYLTSQDTLQKWTGYTLAFRSILFHRRFPNKVISASALCRLYKKHQIKRKVVARFKGCNDDRIQEYLEWQEESWQELQEAWRLKQRVVYIDECVFTKSTIPRLEYAAKGFNQTVDEKEYYHRYFACVAAISVDRGVDGVMVFDQAVTAESFIKFLEALHAQTPREPINVFLDNLVVHKTEEVRAAMKRLNIKPIWNIPYRFEFMPIELVFS